MYPIRYPNYQNCIMNVTVSILNHYGVPSDKNGVAILDEYLKKDYRNVVYVLIDGMGSKIIDKYSNQFSFTKKNMLAEITSVFPSTTVAATTSVLTGLSPKQTGWIGWAQFIKEISKTVIFFYNEDYYNPGKKFEENIGDKYCSTTKIYDLIKQHSPKVSVHEVFPAFKQKEHTSFSKECDTIVNICNDEGEHFIYAYWDKLDSVMHEFGPSSKEAQDSFKTIDANLEMLSSKLPSDTLLIVIADHGQVDVCPIELRKYSDLWNLFIHEPSVESRATAFFIQKDRKAEFENLFNHYFRDYFILLSKEQALLMGLFGEGEAHLKLDDFLGDYLAIAIDCYYFKFTDDSFTMKGQHAGLLEDEMLVPLIIHSKK